jgi:hypothetical protein
VRAASQSDNHLEISHVTATMAWPVYMQQGECSVRSILLRYAAPFNVSKSPVLVFFQALPGLIVRLYTLCKNIAKDYSHVQRRKCGTKHTMKIIKKKVRRNCICCCTK